MENLNKIQVSVVVPVFNEEKSIKEVVAGLKNELNNLGVVFEIIAVNDASSDESGKILSEIDGIKLINHEKNKGYGASLKTGIKNSNYDWILIIDGDGTYPVSAIPKFIEQAGKYDLVTGRRDTENCAIPFKRKHAKKFLNKFASYLAGKEVPDLNCGLRIFRKEIVLKYWEIFPDKFSFTSTLTMTCLTHGYETLFIPIDYYKREGKSTMKAGEFFRFMKLVLKLSLFFKPIKVFVPISLIILLGAIAIILLFAFGITPKFLDGTFIILCATALQTFFFGLLAEIIIHNK